MKFSDLVVYWQFWWSGAWSCDFGDTGHFQWFSDLSKSSDVCVFFNDFDGDFNDSKDFGNPGDCEGSDIEFQCDSDNLGILVIF